MNCSGARISGSSIIQYKLPAARSIRLNRVLTRDGWNKDTIIPNITPKTDKRAFIPL